MMQMTPKLKSTARLRDARPILRIIRTPIKEGIGGEPNCSGSTLNPPNWVFRRHDRLTGRTQTHSPRSHGVHGGYISANAVPLPPRPPPVGALLSPRRVSVPHLPCRSFPVVLPRPRNTWCAA